MLNIQLLLYFLDRKLHYIFYVHKLSLLLSLFIFIVFSINRHFDLRTVITQILRDTLA